MKVKIAFMDSTIVWAHRYAAGASKKGGRPGAGAVSWRTGDKTSPVCG